MAEQPNPGRARVAENRRKKKRSVSLSDDEHRRLQTLATTAQQSISEYIINQLKLRK